MHYQEHLQSVLSTELWISCVPSFHTRFSPALSEGSHSDLRYIMSSPYPEPCNGSHLICVVLRFLWFSNWTHYKNHPFAKKTGSVQLCSDSFSTSLHKTSAHLELFLPYPASVSSIEFNLELNIVVYYL